jgi:hypothetical protein
VFDWLFEGRIEVYCLLGVVAVILLLVWWRSRKPAFLLAAAAVAALAGAYFILDRLVETPREQIVRKLQEMADAVKARDADAIFKHIAKDFNFRGQNRDAFHGAVESVLNRGLIGELVIYDPDWRDPGDENVRPVRFMAKPKGGAVGDQPAYFVRAKFVREADGQWRMQSFRVYNPVAGEQEMDIPLPP